MSNALPLLIAGGAALFLLGGKKKRSVSGGGAMTFEDEDIVGSPPTPEPGPNDVEFNTDLTEFKLGSSWKIGVLDSWLNKRRLAGKLATIDRDEGWLYEALITDPTTWLGDITGTGKVGGSVIYGSLWLMATVGVGVYASGFASAGANITAATKAASATRAMQILGPRATKIARYLHGKGLSGSRIALALKDFGGAQSLTKLGVRKAIFGLSAGATGLGVQMTGALLAEMAVDNAFSEDIAASTVEAAAEFTIGHSVGIAGESIPIAMLPSTYQAAAEFNKFIMAYIIKFQKMNFED